MTLSTCQKLDGKIAIKKHVSYKKITYVFNLIHYRNDLLIDLL